MAQMHQSANSSQQVMNAQNIPPCDFPAHAQGLGLGAKDEGEDEKAAKRARTFMRDFAALPLDSLSPKQAVAQSQKLYNQLVADAASMPTLQRLIQV